MKKSDATRRGFLAGKAKPETARRGKRKATAKVQPAASTTSPRIPLSKRIDISCYGAHILATVAREIRPGVVETTPVREGPAYEAALEFLFELLSSAPCDARDSAKREARVGQRRSGDRPYAN